MTSKGGLEDVVSLFSRKRGVEILDFLEREDDSNFTKIQRDVNISSETASNNLTFLEEIGLVWREEEHHNSIRYGLTEKGSLVMKKSREIAKVLDR